MCAPWTRCSNCLRAVEASWTLQRRCGTVVQTLWGRCVHAITGKFDIFGAFHGDPTARWQVYRTLYTRCDIAVWCDRGFKWVKCTYQIRLFYSRRKWSLLLNIFETAKMSDKDESYYKRHDKRHILDKLDRLLWNPNRCATWRVRYPCAQIQMLTSFQRNCENRILRLV